MIDLPLGATEDRVCGTIAIEKALTEGECKIAGSQGRGVDWEPGQVFVRVLRAREF